MQSCMKGVLFPDFSLGIPPDWPWCLFNLVWNVPVACLIYDRGLLEFCSQIFLWESPQIGPGAYSTSYGMSLLHVSYMTEAFSREGLCHIRDMQQGHSIRGRIGTRANLGGCPEKNLGTELLSYSSASSCTDRFKSLGRLAITEYIYNDSNSTNKGILIIKSRNLTGNSITLGVQQQTHGI